MINYAWDKPANCRYCYYWDRRKSRCVLSKERCYYIVELKEKHSACIDCPYGAHRPCIGFCMKKILGQGV